MIGGDIGLTFGERNFLLFVHVCSYTLYYMILGHHNSVGLLNWAEKSPRFECLGDRCGCQVLCRATFRIT